MAALIAGMAVMAILMTAAMPVWRHLAQREKEEELVFRGEQYAHAIGMFQRRTANAYPPNLDVLVQQKLLRKKYKDPITNDDFVPLSQTQAAGRGAQQGGAQQPQQGRGQQAGAATPGQTIVAGGIIGVTSKSTDTSIRLYKGRSHYNEWAFIYTPPAQAPGAGGPAGAQGAGGRAGQGPGRGGQQGPNFPGGGFPGGGRGAGGPGGQGRGAVPPTGTFNPFPGGGRGR